MRTPTAALLLALTCALPANAELRVSRLVGDGMVLQRGTPVAIWGWADAGARVDVTFDGREQHGEAGDDGRWTVTLPAREAGGPFVMTIASGEERLEVGDVLVGDVWLCSGQSNMEWPVSQARDFEAEAVAATDRKIRHFKVPKSYAEQPEDELAGGEWVVASPETVGDFTAVGYFFARELRRHVDVPIGLVNSSWGGSRVEPWMRASALGFDSPEEAVQDGKRQVAEASARKLKELRAKLGEPFAEDRGMDGERAAWADPDLDDLSWETMEMPNPWEREGYDGLDGVGWFRRHVELTAEEASANATLSTVGAINAGDVWLNGQRIGGRIEWAPRVETVNPGVLRAGDNVVTIRVENEKSWGGIWGPPEQMYLEVGEKRFPLAGEWLFKVGVFQFNADYFETNQFQTLLYNKMIHPILDLRIRGALWYQGESNADNRDDAVAYRDLFPAMIRDWRELWGFEFPFLFVQLANFMESADEPGESDWALLRESQSAALALPKTAQAVIIDIGEADDIHPRNKQEVGRRLSLAARRVAYGEDVVHSGPVYRGHEVRDGKVVLRFDHVGGGLVARGGELKEFAVAGADGKLVWAQAKIDGESVVVWSESVPEPVAVRYAWADNPDGANLYNAEGLPASPFRTDGERVAP